MLCNMRIGRRGLLGLVLLGGLDRALAARPVAQDNMLDGELAAMHRRLLA